MEVITNLREYYLAKHDEYRKLSDEAWAKAEECDGRGDRKGWAHYSAISLEYLNKCFEILSMLSTIG